MLEELNDLPGGSSGPGEFADPLEKSAGGEAAVGSCPDFESFSYTVIGAAVSGTVVGLGRFDSFLAEEAVHICVPFAA